MADGQGKAHPEQRPYWTLCFLLAVLTTCEWALFGWHQAWGVPVDLVVPVLLALSAFEFAMVVAWFARPRGEMAWAKRAVPVAFVMGGGAALLLGTLLRR